MTQDELDAISEYWLCENKYGEQYVVRQAIWQTKPDNAIREVSKEEYEKRSKN